MPWVRFDDQYPVNRKVRRLSNGAFRLHTSAICWCAQNLTDGFVSAEDLGDVAGKRLRSPGRLAAECVDRGVWHPCGQECPAEKCPAPVSGDGWVIHDYWEFQPKKGQVLRERKAAAERQAKWRAARQSPERPRPATMHERDTNATRTRHQSTSNDDYPQGYPQGGESLLSSEFAENGQKSNAVSNAVSASSPPRPPLKGEGRAEPARVPARASHGRGRDPALPPGTKPHPFIPGNDGLCAACQFPEPNRRHRED